MSIFDEPKIDCHLHVLDPDALRRTGPTTHYRPMPDRRCRHRLRPAHRHARRLRHASRADRRPQLRLRTGQPRVSSTRSSAVPGASRASPSSRNDIGDAKSSMHMKEAGVVGVAWNVTFYGGAVLRRCADRLLARLAASSTCACRCRWSTTRWSRCSPMLERSRGIRVLDGPLRTSDHRRRPAAAGIPRACSRSPATGRAVGQALGRGQDHARSIPVRVDAQPYLDALAGRVSRRTRCLWASDWPYLRAPARMDYGVLLKHCRNACSPIDAVNGKRVLWDTPMALLGFGSLGRLAAVGARNAVGQLAPLRRRGSGPHERRRPLRDLPSTACRSAIAAFAIERVEAYASRIVDRGFAHLLRAPTGRAGSTRLPEVARHCFSQSRPGNVSANEARTSLLDAIPARGRRSSRARALPCP